MWEVPHTLTALVAFRNLSCVRATENLVSCVTLLLSKVCSVCDGEMCFNFRQLIYNYPEQLFGAAGVMAIEHADFAGVERLALVTGV